MFMSGIVENISLSWKIERTIQRGAAELNSFIQSFNERKYFYYSTN